MSELLNLSLIILVGIVEILLSYIVFTDAIDKREMEPKEAFQWAIGVLFLPIIGICLYVGTVVMKE